VAFTGKLNSILGRSTTSKLTIFVRSDFVSIRALSRSQIVLKRIDRFEAVSSVSKRLRKRKKNVEEFQSDSALFYMSGREKRAPVLKIVLVGGFSVHLGAFLGH
jgi:hypothetical protein